MRLPNAFAPPFPAFCSHPALPTNTSALLWQVRPEAPDDVTFRRVGADEIRLLMGTTGAQVSTEVQV